MTPLMVCALWAGEIAVLANGFHMAIDRHEVRGDQIALITAGGESLVPRELIASFEVPPVEPGAPATAAETIPTLAPTTVKTPRDLIRDAAQLHGLPPEFVEAVARQESAFQPAALSPKGALGLMQLMPDTAKTLGVDPRDPAQNSEGGARLLRELLLQYQGHPDQVRRALAAYNAGPGAVKKYNGVPPYRETQDYIERVLGHYHRASASTNKQ